MLGTRKLLPLTLIRGKAGGWIGRRPRAIVRLSVFLVTPQYLMRYHDLPFVGCSDNKLSQLTNGGYWTMSWSEYAYGKKSVLTIVIKNATIRPQNPAVPKPSSMPWSSPAMTRREESSATKHVPHSTICGRCS